MMKQTTKIPLISKLSDSSSYLYPIGQKQLSQDVFASHIYESLISYKFKTPMQDEYRHQIIKSEQ